VQQPQRGEANSTSSSNSNRSSNQYASGASQNTGNVLTDRRTTRVNAPPGGASSFTLG